MLPAVTCCARAGMVVPSVAVSLRGVWTSVVALRSFVSVVAGGGGARQSPERSAAGGHERAGYTRIALNAAITV